MKHRIGIVLCLLSLWAGGMGVFGSIARASDDNASISQEIDPYQVMFSIGVIELHKQHYANAIKIFKALSKETPSQRVRLELARAYFLDRQYELAGKTFEAVLADSSLPWGVRENVNRYLDLSDEAMGRVKFSLAIVSDSNPLNFTDHNQINIAGQTLTVSRPSRDDTVYGLQYGLNATKSFTDDASLVGYLNINVKDFESGDLDRWIVDTGVGLFPRRLRKFQARLGLEESFFGGDHHYHYPYVSMTYFPDPIEQFRFSTALKLAYLDVSGFDYLDAHIQTLDLRGSRILAGGMQLVGNLYGENAATDEQSYSYHGAGLGTTLSFPLVRSWGADVSASIGVRRYRDVDPFFGEQREDSTKRLSLVLHNQQWRFFDFTPEFGAAYERTDSNIEFFEYDKLTLIMRTRY